jgi:hypothetical protein
MCSLGRNRPTLQALDAVQHFLQANEFWSNFAVFEAVDFVKSVRKHYTDSDFELNFNRKAELDVLVTTVSKETTFLKKMKAARS